MPFEMIDRHRLISHMISLVRHRFCVLGTTMQARRSQRHFAGRSHRQLSVLEERTVHCRIPFLVKFQLL